MVVDKARVIAVGLIRRKIAKTPTDLIRRKFSIDAQLWRDGAACSASTNSKPYGEASGNLRFTICVCEMGK
jgi:hypothetical protein